MFTQWIFLAPSWIKPYHVLSNGEQFRCDLARALSQTTRTPDADSVPLAQPVPPVVAFDELQRGDRNVARGHFRADSQWDHLGRIGCRFVA